MKKRYDQVMDRIRVTDEMRSRILACLGSEAPEAAAEQGRKHRKLPNFIKYLSAAACLLVLVTGVLTLPGLVDRPEQADPPVQVVPDIVEFPDAGTLSESVGFTVWDGNTLPFEVTAATYLIYWQELAEIKYGGKDQSAVFRKSAGSEDNSGDFSQYEELAEITVDTNTVTLKGNDGAFYLALWTDGEFSYSLRLSRGLQEEEWITILSGIH